MPTPSTAPLASPEPDVPSELAAFLDPLGLKQTVQVAAALDDAGIEVTKDWLALTDSEFDEAMLELKEAHVKLGDRQKLRLARSQSALQKNNQRPSRRKTVRWYCCRLWRTLPLALLTLGRGPHHPCTQRSQVPRRAHGCA